MLFLVVFIFLIALQYDVRLLLMMDEILYNRMYPIAVHNLLYWFMNHDSLNICVQIDFFCASLYTILQPQVMIMIRSSGHHHPCFVYPFSFITSVSDVSLAQAIQTPINHFHICKEICMGRYNTRARVYYFVTLYVCRERE